MSDALGLAGFDVTAPAAQEEGHPTKWPRHLAGKPHRIAATSAERSSLWVFPNKHFTRCS
jgi:hypothetical protein